MLDKKIDIKLVIVDPKSGKAPVRVLSLSFKVVSWFKVSNSLGIDPVRRLLDRSMDTRVVTAPSDVGILFVKEFDLKSLELIG